MSSPFEIDADVSCNLIHVRILGPMAAEDVDRLFEARARLTALFDCEAGEHRALVDMREAPLQSEEMIERIEAHSGCLMLEARRAAIVLAPGASPARLQARDLGARYNLCLFDRMDDAERWIRL